MISCTEFIPAYSELFKYLHQKGGKQAVVTFWENLSDAFLDDLREAARERGLRGIFEHFSHTLTEEAADFRMTLDEENGVIDCTMRYCPSKGRLNQLEHIEPYEFYCEHCALLYPRALEPLGFEYTIDLSQTDNACCHAVIRRKS